MTEIEKYKGYSLVFSTYSEKFQAKDENGKTITTSESFSGLKVNVDAFVKRKKKLKPFDVIRLRSNDLVRVSSIASDEFDEIWISWKDPKANRRSRSREGIFDRYRFTGTEKEYYFFKKTAQNMLTLTKINKAEKCIEVIQSFIDRIEKTYSDPITAEMLELLVNPTKKEK